MKQNLRKNIYMCTCVLVAQLCPTLCNPMDCSPLGSSFLGILQARILEWFAISFSNIYMCVCMYIYIYIWQGFPGGSDSKASVYNVGDPDSVPGLRRSPGEGNGNLLQYSCLKNSVDGVAWKATVHGIAKSRTRLSNFTSEHFMQRWAQ